jgi:hypothetical protein
MREQYEQTLLLLLFLIVGASSPLIAGPAIEVFVPSAESSNNSLAKVVYLRSVVDSIQEEGCKESLLEQDNPSSQLPSWMALQELDLDFIQQSLLQQAFGYPLSSGDRAQIQWLAASNGFVPIIKGRWEISCFPSGNGVNFHEVDFRLQLHAEYPGSDSGGQCTINQRVDVKSISKNELQRRLRQNQGEMVAKIRRACDPRNPAGRALTVGLMQEVYDWEAVNINSHPDVEKEALQPQNQRSESKSVIRVVDFPELSFKTGSASSTTLPTTLHFQFDQQSEASEERSVVDQIYLKREWGGEDEDKTSCYTTPLLSELMSEQPFIHCASSAKRCRKALIGKLLSQKSVVASLSDSAQWRLRACPDRNDDQMERLMVDERYDSVVIKVGRTELGSMGVMCGASLDICSESGCLNSKYYLLNQPVNHTDVCRVVINLNNATPNPENHCSRPLEISSIIQQSGEKCQLQLESAINRQLQQLFLKYPFLHDKGIVGLSTENATGE